ncbi:uncharacterized protein V1510DRAFT_301562 [Dipodascopsis tothii]|uniref:uncharacterized protein n=1 Tax=Dipodascopsis tothii TaxID=44089 RepID=UPI0034CFFF77
MATVAMKRKEPADEADGRAGAKRQVLGDRSYSDNRARAGPVRPGSSGSDRRERGTVASQVSLRCLVSVREAATLIGHGGKNVAGIRQATGVRCSFSDNIRGATERVVTFSGSAESVAMACGESIRVLVDEAGHGPAPRAHALRLLLPHPIMGNVIGKNGASLRELQTSTLSHINASESLLPLSTERSILVRGQAEHVQHACLRICLLLADHAEKLANTHVLLYNPLPMYGVYGHAVGGRREPGAFGPAVVAYAAETEPEPAPDAFDRRAAVQPAVPAVPAVQPGLPLTQQIYIPNDMVGAIIGKGGAKINEIRKVSGSVIKINELQENTTDRLVTITGTSESNQMALYLLYSRLESGKHK